MSNPGRDVHQASRGTLRLRGLKGRPSRNNTRQGARVWKVNLDLVVWPATRRAIRKLHYYVRQIQRRQQQTEERLTNLEREISLLKNFSPLTMVALGNVLSKPKAGQVKRNFPVAFGMLESRQPVPRRRLDGPLGPDRMTLPAIDPDTLADQDLEDIYARLGVRPRT